MDNIKLALLLVVLIPINTLCQSNFTGIWRLKETKVLKGANYLNAIPILIKIDHETNVVTLESTSDLGSKDTVVKETLRFGNWSSRTTMGKKKIISFQKIGNENNTWLKTIEIFTKEDSGKLQSINKETLNIVDGNTLNLLKEYSIINSAAQETGDIEVNGTYERITPELLLKETAVGKGVDFSDGLSWDEIKAKAKKENKYIFIDCYATWCGPCKAMDKYVYPLNMVGEAMNSNFISVKVQMDTTKNDSYDIKRLYPLARKLEKEFSINSLPTYLFFSPNAKPLHKVVGQHSASDFVRMVEISKNPEKQLYTLVERAMKRRLSWREYPNVIEKLRSEFAEHELARQVASYYYRKYTVTLNEADLLTKSNLDFIAKYPDLVKSHDKIFALCRTQPFIVDSIRDKKNWAKFIVEGAIIREELQPAVLDADKTGKEPNWKILEERVARSYGKDLAETLVLGERVGWYIKKQEWVSFLQYIKPYLACLNLKNVNPGYLHWCAWYVFKYSDDSALIKDAIEWMDIIMPKEDDIWFSHMQDTKACLLYKLGRRDEGINMMKKVADMQTNANQSKIFRQKLEKMNNGESIWLTF